MPSFLELYAPETAQRMQQQRSMVAMGKAWAPNVQDERIRGLLSSDDPANVAAGFGLLNNYQPQEQLKSMVGTQPEMIGATPRDDEGNVMMRAGTGLLGGKMSLPQFYAQMTGLSPEYAKLGVHGLTSTDVGGANTPSAVKEWEYIKREFPGIKLDFPTYLGVKRQMYQLGDLAGVPNLIARAPGIAPTPLSTLPNEVAGQSAIAGGKEGAKTTAEAAAKANFDLPRVEQTVQQATSDIDKLLQHKGLPYITGKYSLLPIIPDTSQAAADALAKQVQGQTFLQAYNTLKGGGQITEIEGTKAEAAIARLQRAQSINDYKGALTELKEVLNVGLERARKQAHAPAKSGKETSAPAQAGNQPQAKLRRYNPATGKIE